MIKLVHNPVTGESLFYVVGLAGVRRARGLSQWRLAVRTLELGCPITPGTISKLEREVRPARQATVRALAKALRSRPHQLIEREDTPAERAASLARHARAERISEAKTDAYASGVYGVRHVYSGTCEVLHYLPALVLLRCQARMTQAQLARAAGLSADTVSQIERRQRPARVPTVGKLAAALGVTRWALRFRPRTDAERAEWSASLADETAAQHMALRIHAAIDAAVEAQVDGLPLDALDEAMPEAVDADRSSLRVTTRNVAGDEVEVEEVSV